MSGAFAVPERALAELRGKRVLLVDDVMTTGSTLLSPLFGVLAQNITMKLYPFVLLLMLVLMTVFSEQLHRKTAAKRAGNA